MGRGRCLRADLHSAPGRSGHHACRHYDRHARCVAGCGLSCRRSDPRPLDGLAHEAWPGSHQGTTPPLGRTVVERRQASAPDSGRGGASRPLRGAPRTRWCGIVTMRLPALRFLAFLVEGEWRNREWRIGKTAFLHSLLAIRYSLSPLSTASPGRGENASLFDIAGLQARGHRAARTDRPAHAA